MSLGYSLGCAWVIHLELSIRSASSKRPFDVDYVICDHQVSKKKKQQWEKSKEKHGREITCRLFRRIANANGAVRACTSRRWCCAWRASVHDVVLRCFVQAYSVNCCFSLKAEPQLHNICVDDTTRAVRNPRGRTSIDEYYVSSVIVYWLFYLITS